MCAYQRPSILDSVSLRNVNWLTDPNLGLSYFVVMTRECLLSKSDPNQNRCHAFIRQSKGAF